MKNLLLFKDVVAERDPTLKNTDRSALYAIVQAAVNVELFTIPLYMTSLYSLYGMHQITGQNNFYQGRMWPGMSTKAEPKTDNDLAFNAIFSVFIAEMLHLQLASNICKAVGVNPTYTSPMLQNKNYGWTCYGPDLTVIPHIIDFLDTIPPYNEIKVKLDAVNKEQIALFLAIEQTEDDAESIIKEDKKDKYFPVVPFAGWKPKYTEADLPMFGSIGHMYECLWNYLSIQYSDGTTLWDDVYQRIQQDLFNVVSPPGHPLPEYPEMATTMDGDNGDKQLSQLKDMINGITDQGEGKGVVAKINARLGLLQKVKPNYQPNEEALKKDYPSYTDTGKEAPSRDAKARSMFGALDHFETFQKVNELLDKGNIKTWDQWHAEGNVWTPDMLKTDGYDQNKYPIPAADAIAGALNRLKQNNKDDDNYRLLSHASAGAIAGVTTVLNNYWNNKGVLFPFPSMSGSGDRMSICWAIFGKAPDLSLGIKEKESGILYHACQGMNLDPSQPAENSCAAIEVYHTCKGSNTCKAEGGCGFVQSVDGGSNCGTKVAMLSQTKSAAFKSANPMLADTNKVEGKCSPSWVSAPSDNKCVALGGCAVPISASQMFPAPEPMTGMELFDFGPAPDFVSESIAKIPYKEGELVYDKAWEAYCKVLEHRKQPIPDNPPPPSDIRLAFPPST